MGSQRPANQYSSIYTTTTVKARGWSHNKPKVGEVMAKKTSVQLGRGNKYGFVTTNQRVYPDKDPSQPFQAVNKDFAASIKASHFDIGTRPKSSVMVKKHYLSEANVNFNCKGNAMQLKAKLDQSKKDDLRRNHFGIGGTTADFKIPMSTLQYRPGTAK